MAKAKQSHRPPSQAKGAATQRNGTARHGASSVRATAGAGNGAGGSAGQTGRMSASPRSERIQARANQRRRYQTAPWWRQNNLPIFGVVGVVVVLILIFVFVANRSTGSGSDATVAPASVVNAVTNVSPQVISTVGTGGLKGSLAAVPPSAGGGKLTGSGGKPSVVYIGAEYCPYCAAERWSMIVALSRFGTFSNLHLTTSSSTDINPDTPTFSFYGSSYTSQYVDFQPVETTTRDQNKTLQTPSSAQQHLLDTYDTAQYVGSNKAGGIPFIDFGNQYVQVSSGYLPQILSGMSQQEVASKLSNPNDPVTQQIVGEANYLTAAICQLTNNQPANVCTAAPIPQIEAQLPKGQS